MEQRKKEKVHTSTLLTQHLRFTSFKRLFYLTKTLQFNNEGRSLRARLRKMQLIHQFQTVSQQMLRKSMKKSDREWRRLNSCVVLAVRVQLCLTNKILCKE